MIKLMKGDCLVRMKEIPDKSIDCVITDCPYKVVAGGNSRKDGSPGVAIGGIFTSYKEGFKKGTIFDENSIDFKDWLPDVYRVLKDKTHCYIMINGRNLKDLQTCAEQVGFTFQNLLVWDKGNKTPNRYYMQQLEFILLLSKRPALDINNMGCGNLLSIKNIIGNKLHPSEKPVQLIDIFVKNSTQPNQVVLDPFLGSGSTGIACLNNRVSFIGIEKDPKWFEPAKERILKRYNELKSNIGEYFV